MNIVFKIKQMIFWIINFFLSEIFFFGVIGVSEKYQDSTSGKGPGLEG